jgi:hypothetical protein
MDTSIDIEQVQQLLPHKVDVSSSVPWSQKKDGGKILSSLQIISIIFICIDSICWTFKFVVQISRKSMDNSVNVSHSGLGK